MKFLRTHDRDYAKHRDLKTDGQMESSNLLLLLLVTVAAVVVLVVLVVMVVLVAVMVLEAVVTVVGVSGSIFWMDMCSTVDCRKMCLCILSSSMSTDIHLSTTSFKHLSISCTAFVFAYVLSMT